jgi:hypothetical protein
MSAASSNLVLVSLSCSGKTSGKLKVPKVTFIGSKSIRPHKMSSMRVEKKKHNKNDIGKLRSIADILPTTGKGNSHQ